MNKMFFLVNSVYYLLLFHSAFVFTLSNVEQMSENVDDVSISCDEDLTVECEQTGTWLTWTFRVETEVSFQILIF